ncbi:CdaR family transcriptional regulator [Paenibacillus solisilvae]|uniref:CdaR family transcriptional regulator n=1 Tax=Paenibacillus solisilvae TaxID=2486751 RepID=A0ABW0W2K0_9BACL
MLTKEIAGEIIKQTMTRLNRNINIMDHDGTIIASGDPDRINQLHEGALDVLRTGKPITVTKKNKQHWKGALPGINLPIQFQGQMIGVIGITGNPEEIEEFGALVKMITEMMINQSFLTAQEEWRHRLKELIFDEWVQEEPNLETVKQRLNLLGMKVGTPCQVGLLEIDNSDRPLMNRELIRKLEEIFNEKRVMIGSLNVNRLFLLALGITEGVFKRKLNQAMDLLQRMNIAFRIGLGSSVKNPALIRYSLEESEISLLLGNGEQKLIAYAEIETKALIERVDARIKQQYLERILQQMPDKMVETLECFFANNLNISETAKAMYIHRNSLIYRIKKIKEDTGYNPQLFQDAVSLQLAVWIYTMRKK